MLGEIKDVLKERYYDKSFRGIDIDARFKTAAEKIKTLSQNRQIFRVIAQVVVEFEDSHTRFIPPNRANRVEYGFSMQMVGDKCLVVDVKKGSDAEAHGLKVGDQIVGVDQMAPTRQNLWKIEYLLYALDPQESLKLYIAGPNNTEREIEIRATFKSIEDRKKEAEKRKKEKRENPWKCQAVNPETVACRLETFSVDKKHIDKMMAEAVKYKKLILDLRGNGGGYVKIEQYLTGHFFDREIKIGDLVMRDKKKAIAAKPQTARRFAGDLIVLIDSNSASAAEVFARVIQIEKRGKVVGDVSAGAVMTSNFLTMANVRGVEGWETLSFYGLNVTVADLIMSDGNRLENVGVVPDHPVGPTGAPLNQKFDPVLAYAAQLLGAEISPEAAGKFHFLAKPAEDDDEEESGDPEN